MSGYSGRHRASSSSFSFSSRPARTLAAVGTAGAVIAAPIAFADGAQAASGGTWDRLAQCESSGNWAINTGNGYYGGLQFSYSTWRGFGGGRYASTANHASRSQQITIAEKVLDVQGWGAWPACSRKLGLTSADAGGSPGTSASTHRHAVRHHKKKAVRSTQHSATRGSYVVRSGDTLSKIAARYHVRGGWPALYAHNRSAIGSNPNLIQVGLHLALPR